MARHLLAAGELLDADADLAYRHAVVARRLAGRVGVVREAVGVAAYAAGRFAEALAELRATRRITGSVEHLPLLADAERGLGRPDRALALAAGAEARRLDRAGQVELRIVAAGARRDLGQYAAAVVLLQGPDLDPARVEGWTPRLWYAYADALVAAGRPADAVGWFERVADLDDGQTDAAERVAGLAGGAVGLSILDVTELPAEGSDRPGGVSG